MGGIISTIHDIINTITDVIALLSSLNAKYKALLTRISSPPGLPVPNPTSPYWLDDPPFPNLVNIANPIPTSADVVIIGSGIASAASARSILQLTAHLDPPPRVVVLEARHLCSGATGRNGGHIKTSPYEVFRTMKQKLGPERAVEIVRFQMKHLGVLGELGSLFPLGDVREVETVDLFLEEDAWVKSVEAVDDVKRVVDFDAKVWKGDEARKMFDVNHHIKGAISYPAGALWPYRLITSIWNDLLNTYSNLSITTNTPVEAIHPTTSTSHPYAIKYPQGTIQARHVLHATNGHTTQLLPALKTSITGALAHMSAQKPPSSFPKYNGTRSWSIIYPPGFEYITQLPDQHGESGALMVGGGFFRSKDEGFDQVGVWDDGREDAFPLMHIRGCMGSIFEPRWGEGGAVTKSWTGIMGVTGDFMPFVGRVPRRYTGKGFKSGGTGQGGGLAAPGQWIAAGFCGEGMVWAWLSGMAVGVMIAGREDEQLDKVVGRPGGKLDEWFPMELGLEGGRLRRADLKNLASDVI